MAKIGNVSANQDPQKMVDSYYKKRLRRNA